MPRSMLRLRVALPMFVLVAACSAAPPPADAVDAVPTAAPAEVAPIAEPVPASDAPAPAMSPLAASADSILVHKSPTCGCCGAWVEHLRASGFRVEVNETDDLPAVQARVGVPAGKGSCHTAEVGGYFVEGHVPAQDIRRLLADKPDARGLTVPGMPLGSPGMEAPGHEQPYSVLLVDREGETSEFATHGPVSE